jgi:sugar fermentation stimulation protein A
LGDERVYVEVKSTTLVRHRTAAFPDAVTERGLKHLDDLMGVMAAGHRAALVFCVQRRDCDRFTPADDIDPAYGVRLREAIAAGLEVYPLRYAPSLRGVTLDGPIPVAL